MGRLFHTRRQLYKLAWDADPSEITPDEPLGHWTNVAAQTEIGLFASLLGSTGIDPYAREYLSSLVTLWDHKYADRMTPLLANCPPKGGLDRTGQDICVGTLESGEAFPLPVHTLLKNAVIAGVTGAGKTTLALWLFLQAAMLGALVIVQDLKNTWAALARHPLLEELLIVIDLEDIRMAPLQPPCSMDRRKWVNTFVSLFAEAFGRLAAQRILRRAIDRCLATMPVDESPTLAMIAKSLRSMKVKSWREREYIGSILAVIEDLLANLHGTFDCTTSNFSERLQLLRGRIVVIKNRGLPADIRSFIQSLIVQQIMAPRIMGTVDTWDTPILFASEDASSELSRVRDYARNAPPLMATNMNIGRELGIGFIPIVHSLSQISPEILPNVGTFMVAGIGGQDLPVARQLLGLNRDQAEFLRVSPPGTGCLFSPSIYPKAFSFFYPPLPEGAV